MFALQHIAGIPHLPAMSEIRRNFFSRDRLFCQPMYQTQTLDAIASQRSRARSAHPWLYRLVFGLDAWLRRWTLVAEYSPDPRCVFRVQLGHLDQDVALPDGTIAHAGDRVIDLHLWNEHVPLMPKQGATIAWARRMCFCIEVSLRELAKHLVARPELDDISVIRANITFGIPGQSAQMSRLCQRYGFQVVGTLNPTKMLQRIRQRCCNAPTDLARTSSYRSWLWL